MLVYSEKFIDTFDLKLRLLTKDSGYGKRKDHHNRKFPLLLNAPEGFLEREYPFMYALHAEAVAGEVCATVCIFVYMYM